MAIGTTEAIHPSPASPANRPLEMGDRLTRVEFERRYQRMAGLKKAELIEGMVFMPSPVSAKHSGPHVKLVTWLGVYLSATPGVVSGDNSTVRFDEDNELQPDVLLAIEAACGGQSQIDEDDFFAGPPELIAEVASSSVSYDLHDKLRVYCRHGVREYLVWRVHDGEIDWFRLDEGKYLPIGRDGSGIQKSSVFPGLWLNAAALLSGGLAEALATLHQGIASPEHGDFITGLNQRRRRG